MKYVIVLDLGRREKGIMINALVEFRNKLLQEDIDPEPVNALLLKLLDAPEKKRMFPRRYVEVR